MKKVIALNGSPRKNRNTAKMLKSALDGAASQGAEVEIVHLYDYLYKGCFSCYGCKIKETEKYTELCTVKDDMTSILEKVHAADACVLGSPIFFEGITGQLKSFLERLLFPVLTYRDGFKSKLTRVKPFGFVYTMNVTAEFFEEANYMGSLHFAQRDIERLFGYCKHIAVHDTVQFDNYSKYDATDFSERHKRNNQNLHFDNDLKRAFDLGVELAELSDTLNSGQVKFGEYYKSKS